MNVFGVVVLMCALVGSLILGTFLGYLIWVGEERDEYQERSLYRRGYIQGYRDALNEFKTIKKEDK